MPTRHKKTTLTLRNLFYALTALLVGASITQATLPFTIVILCYWGLAFRSKLFVKYPVFWQLLIFLPAVSALALSIFISGVLRNASARTICFENYRSLTTAMLSHESAHGSFPAALTRKQKGQPLYSWRVAILPMLDRSDLYDQYKFDQPWDSPENRKLLPKIPSVMQCPQHARRGSTTYKLVTGPGSVFIGERTPLAADIKDGLGKSIMMIEDFGHPVPWTKPEDLSVQQAVEILSAANRQGNREKCAHSFEPTWGTYPIGNIVAFFDGSTRLVDIDTDAEEIQAALLCSDGAEIDPWNLMTVSRQSSGELNWRGIVLLGLFSVLIFAPYPKWLWLEKRKQAGAESITKQSQ